MPRTAFAPEVHGFAFENRWHFAAEEREQLRALFARYLPWGGLLGAAAFGLLGALLIPFAIPGAVITAIAGAALVPLAILALRNHLERHLDPGYGLCGGMCFAALDFFTAGRPLPRGQGPRDRPSPGTHMRSYIWRRQINSLVSDGARFVAWLIFLNAIPTTWPFRGGPAWLAARSRKEWERLKANVDTGQPVPIGLVRATKNLYDNHQVIAIGYDEADDTQGTIYLYDPNCPDRESSIRLQFGERGLDGEENCGTDAPMRGFFCEAYSPTDPGEARKWPGD